MSKSRILEPKSYVKWAWNLVQSVSLWFLVHMRGQQKELRRRGGNDRLFKWEVKDTTNASEVGHCLILTARLRETQAKEVMSGQINILQKFSSQESQEQEKVDRLYWVAWQSWWWCNKNNLLSLFFLLLSLTSMAPDSNLKFRFLLYFLCVWI